MTERGRLLVHFVMYCILLAIMAITSWAWPLIYPRLNWTISRIKKTAQSVLKFSGISNQGSDNYETQQQLVEFDNTQFGTAWFSLALTLFTGFVQICIQSISCRYLEDFSAPDESRRWRYDGSESCYSPWQAGPIVALIILVAAPALMAWRASSWLHNPPKTRWEQGVKIAYERSFRRTGKHWGMVLLYERVLLLFVVELVDQPFPRALSAAVICSAFMLVEARTHVFALKQVQLLHVRHCCCCI